MGLKRKDSIDNINRAMVQYYSEQINGSFYKEVLKPKKTVDKNGIPNSFDLVTKWMNKKVSEAKEIFEKNPNNQKVINETQEKLAVYAKLNRDFFKQEEMKISESVRKTNEYKEATKENNKIRSDIWDAYKVADGCFRNIENNEASLNSSNRYPTIKSKLKEYKNREKNSLGEEVNKQGEEKKNQINDHVSERVNNYRNMVTPKKNNLENYLNDKFKANITVDQDFLNNAREASEQISDKNFNSVADMANDYENRIINPAKNEINDRIKQVEDPINGMKERAFDENGSYSFVGDGDVEAASVNVKNIAKENLSNQMAVYMAAKKARESRNFLSKAFNAIFRRGREKQEKDKLAEMRNNLKEALHADDRYMNDLDNYIKGKDVEPRLTNPNVELKNKEFDFNEELDQRAEDLECEETRKELEKSTKLVKDDELSEMVDEQEMSLQRTQNKQINDLAND